MSFLFSFMGRLIRERIGPDSGSSREDFSVDFNFFFFFFFGSAGRMRVFRFPSFLYFFLTEDTSWVEEVLPSPPPPIQLLSSVVLPLFFLEVFRFSKRPSPPSSLSISLPSDDGI